MELEPSNRHPDRPLSRPHSLLSADLVDEPGTPHTQPFSRYSGCSTHLDDALRNVPEPIETGPRPSDGALGYGMSEVPSVGREGAKESCGFGGHEAEDADRGECGLSLCCRGQGGKCTISLFIGEHAFLSCSRDCTRRHWPLQDFSTE